MFNGEDFLSFFQGCLRALKKNKKLINNCSKVIVFLTLPQKRHLARFSSPESLKNVNSQGKSKRKQTYQFGSGLK